MGDRLKILKARSNKRRELLAQGFGVTKGSLGNALKSRDEQEEVREVLSHPKVLKLNVDVVNTSAGTLTSETSDQETKKEDLGDTLFTGSDTFLKGTQSANPHNDYCQNFVDTGERPQNFIRDVGLANRFEEYPKLRELIRLKDELIAKTASPPMYFHCDLELYDLSDLGTKFDVIYLEPPLEEYQRTNGAHYDKFWTWEEIEQLEIEKISAQRSFIWMWCGAGNGLDWARKCLKRWGYRRCEDICWIKTNIKNPGHKKNMEPKAVFQRTKEHCLMGIKGTVRRSTDGDFIHANVDIDLIIEEEFEYGNKEKPIEIFHMMEHFCLGRRRLHIFGRDSTIRPGWLTVGTEVTSSNFDATQYADYFKDDTSTGCTDEIERLRPKSPIGKSRGGGPPGRGGGPPGRGGPARGAYSGPPSRGRGEFRGRGRGSYRGSDHF